MTLQVLLILRDTFIIISYEGPWSSTVLSQVGDSSGWATILISQQKYTSNIVDAAALTDTKIVDTPLELHSKLLPSDSTPLADPTRYCKLVGKHVYLYLTISDIAHAVSTVSQFVSAPHSAHYSTLFRILIYLRGTITRSLFMSFPSSLELQAYSDAD